MDGKKESQGNSCCQLALMMRGIYFSPIVVITIVYKFKYTKFNNYYGTELLVLLLYTLFEQVSSTCFFSA